MATKSATDPTTLVTETFLAGMKQGQELAFSGLSAWADAAGKAFALPSMPSFDSLPGFDAIPSPKSFVEASFGFAEELLASQKEFTLKVVETVAATAEKAPKA
jgi:predicted oxidoreductase